MTLEKNIERIADALEKIAAVACAAPVEAKTAKAEEKAPPKKVEKAKKEEVQETVTDSEVPEEEAAPTAENLKYEDIKAPFLALYAVDAQAAHTILKGYGIPKLTELPEEKWPACLAKITEAMPDV